MGFKFPNLTSFLSLMPQSRQHQVCVLQPNREAEESLTAVTCDASFPSSWSTQCLHRTWAISSVGPMLLTTTRTCVWFTETTWKRPCSWRPYASAAFMTLLKWVSNPIAVQIFVSAPQESLPAVVMRPTLPCVWPMALSSSKRSEVNRWFDQSLRNYLVFLTKSLISPKVTYNSSCVAFQKL